MLLPNVWQITPRQLCRFALRKAARVATQGFQIRDCMSLSGSTLHTSHFTTSTLHEILFSFNRKSLHWSNFDTLASEGFGPNTGADTQAAFH
jgi:hypothetical protein